MGSGRDTTEESERAQVTEISLPNVQQSTRQWRERGDIAVGDSWGAVKGHNHFGIDAACQLSCHKAPNCVGPQTAA